MAKSPKAKTIKDIDIELQVMIRSTMRICDEAKDQRLMVRYLLEQALMTLDEIGRTEAGNIKH